MLVRIVQRMADPTETLPDLLALHDAYQEAINELRVWRGRLHTAESDAACAASSLRMMRKGFDAQVMLAKEAARAWGKALADLADAGIGDGIARAFEASIPRAAVEPIDPEPDSGVRCARCSCPIAVTGAIAGPMLCASCNETHVMILGEVKARRFQSLSGDISGGGTAVPTRLGGSDMIAGIGTSSTSTVYGISFCCPGCNAVRGVSGTAKWNRCQKCSARASLCPRCRTVHMHNATILDGEEQWRIVCQCGHEYAFTKE